MIPLLVSLAGASPPAEPLPAGRWEPEVHAALQEMIVSHGVLSPTYDPDRPPVAVFDWDNTCIRGDIGESLLQVLDERDDGRRIATYEHMCEDQGPEACYAWAAFVVAGMTELDARALAQGIITEVLADGRVQVRPEMRDLIWALQRHGWDVWVVSASVYPAVQAFAQHYGVEPNRVLAVQLVVGDDGLLQDQLSEPLPWRQGKVLAIDRHVGRRPLFAAGDTWTDLEMLQDARYRLLFDRNKREIQHIAEREGWWIQPLFED